MTNRYLAYGKGPRWEMSRFRRRIDEELHQAVYKRQRWSPGERCGNAIDREWQIYSFRVRLPRLTFPSIISGWSFFLSLRFVSPWWETDGFGIIWEDRENTVRMIQTKFSEKSEEEEDSVNEA